MVAGVHLSQCVTFQKTKSIIFPTILLCIILSGCAKDDIKQTLASCDFIAFKYYHGTQYNLGEISNDYLLIGIDTAYSDKQIKSMISGLNQFDRRYNYLIHKSGTYRYKEIPLKLNISKSCTEIAQIIDDLEQIQMVSYTHYTMQTEDCNNLIWESIGDLCINSYGSNFYVKVFDENDLSDLNSTITQTNTELVKQNKFMPKWFELRATKSSSGDALAMANYFFETRLFAHSEPGISKFPVK